MSGEGQTAQIIVTDEQAGQRLDKLLFAHYGGEQSRSYFQKLIAEKLVLLNGEPVKKRVSPAVGDEIEVEFALAPELHLTPEAIPLDILFEDQELLIVNKPAGLVVHPAPGNWTGTFVNALLHHCGGDLQVDATLRPGIVHRLDKDTSGCLVAAKTLSMQQRLVALFSQRKVQKEYLAICLGNPGKGTIDQPIARHALHRKMMAVDEERGKIAVTHYATLASDGRRSVVHLLLETGRTHQIRVHLQYLSTPVLGDDLYGQAARNKAFGVERQLLHARRLSFQHPTTGEDLQVVAPLPEDFSRQVRGLDPRLQV